MTTGHRPNPVKRLVDLALPYDHASPGQQANARTLADAVLSEIRRTDAGASSTTLAVFAQGAVVASTVLGSPAPPVVVLAVGALARRILDGEIDQ